MGQSQSTITDTVDKGQKKTDKVLKSVSAQVKSTAADVKKTANKAADKTSSSANKAAKGVDKATNKAAKDVTKAINKALDSGSKDNEDSKVLKGIALAVPVVALAVAVGAYLWKEKPWKKGKGGSGAKPAAK